MLKKQNVLEKQDIRLPVILIILLSIILLFNIYFYFQAEKILDIGELEASVNVSDRVGFDLNDSMLVFGRIIPGFSVTKKVSIENNFGVPIIVEVYGKGEIARFLEPFEIKIDKDDVEEIEIGIIIPVDTDLGVYTGKVLFRIKKDI